MTEPKLAYLVTYGSYSDYGVSSVWDDLTACTAATGLTLDMEDGERRIEVYYLNTRQSEPQLFWKATFGDQGVTVSERAEEHSQPPESRANRGSNRRGPAEGWSAVGYGRSPEGARKVVSDVLAQAKAEALEVPA